MQGVYYRAWTEQTARALIGRDGKRFAWTNDVQLSHHLLNERGEFFERNIGPLAGEEGDGSGHGERG